MDADVWIENIPYDETRSYVEAILEHIVAYGWTRGGAPPQLAALLPPIGPAAAPTPALTPALGGVLRGAGRPLPALSAP
jgi:soluble lytic murein transglycosylase